MSKDADVGNGGTRAVRTFAGRRWSPLGARRSEGDPPAPKVADWLAVPSNGEPGARRIDPGLKPARTSRRSNPPASEVEERVREAQQQVAEVGASVAKLVTTSSEADGNGRVHADTVGHDEPR